MLRRSSLVECVSVLHGTCLQSVKKKCIRQYVQPRSHISKNVKKCLSDKFIQNWNNNVMNSAKCLNYRIYKSNFCFEQYLSVLP